MNLLKSKTQIFITLLSLGFVGWWISFHHEVAKLPLSTQRFGETYGVIALIGSLIGFIVAKKWGGFHSVLGKALMFFSLGLFAQEFGQMAYNYYIIVDKITIPYPSWGDAGYFGSTLLYIVGVFFLAKAAGANISLKSAKYRLIALFTPILILGISYPILMHNFVYGHSSGLAIFLDNAYPIGEAIYISIAVTAYLLSKKLLGGVMKNGFLFIIFALIVEYISDFTFVYQSNRGSYIPGSWDDLLYVVAYYVMSLALLKFYLIYRKINKGAAVGGEEHNQPKPVENLSGNT